MKISLFYILMFCVLMTWIACTPKETTLPVQDPDQNVYAVFIGNSITEIWKWDHPSFFSRNNYVNTGIGGQTTSQMLARFQTDVVDLKPQCVVIMGGVNDIARNAGYSPTLEGIRENIGAMAVMAQCNGIHAIICSTPPAQNVNWNIPIPDATQKIVSLNLMLKEYADANNALYVDFHSMLKDNDDKLKAEYCRGNGDSVHLAPSAYFVIEPIIKEKIDSILSVKTNQTTDNIQKDKNL